MLIHAVNAGFKLRELSHGLFVTKIGMSLARAHMQPTQLQPAAAAVLAL